MRKPASPISSSAIPAFLIVFLTQFLIQRLPMAQILPHSGAVSPVLTFPHRFLIGAIFAVAKVRIGFPQPTSSTSAQSDLIPRL